ncbi:hypothetical protein GYMLUDRAFT_40589 [Collybiopsis luxurians FD-317 M1]|uniref:Protein PNS1 n=1 Tax=Collybiopsis luxurians FD-317 M1 TaxID=944289 RepID=A0A0D0C631_9AGAR|nr:hypothetical protein GYMLUDRAFT_40589 [Collybiopsis luxurians FD-317 M1]
MASSFAAYASQFINRQTQASPSGSQSHPIFFSFTTDNESSRPGSPREEDEEYDLDDPHLAGGSGTGRGSRGFLTDMGLGEIASETEEDTPYLQLDDFHSQAGPSSSKHLQRERTSSPTMSMSESGAGVGGWLAHQGYQGAGERYRSHEDEEENSDKEDDRLLAAEMTAYSEAQGEVPNELGSDSEEELPSGLIASGLRTKSPPQMKGKSRAPQPSSLRPQITLASSNASHLTESLLPSAHTQDAFNLPDPRFIGKLGRRAKYNDALWTSIWLTGVCVSYVAAIVLLFTTRTTSPPNSSKSSPPPPTPYPTLLHTIPLLVPLVILSALASYLHILFLRIWLRPVVWLSALGTPMLLFGCSVWAWVGSFVDEGEEGETWGETTGLRLFSLIPLTFSIILAYRLYVLFTSLPRLQAQITQTELILSLTTRILAENPFVLGLSPVLLFVMLVGSIPFGTVVGRLLLVGRWNKVASGATSEYHLKWGAELAIVLAIGVWLWSWGVARGLLRVVAAGVVGGWYFGVPWAGDRDEEERPQEPQVQLPPDADAELEPPPMFANFSAQATNYALGALPPLVLPSSLSASSPQTHIIHAAFHRATNNSLGSICLSALILTSIRLLTLLVIFLTNLPDWLAWGWSTLGRFLSIWLPPPIVFFARNASAAFAGPIMTQLWAVARRAFFWTIMSAVRYIEGITDSMSRYALVYVGMTGRTWADSARRVGGLMRGSGKTLSPPPLPTLLTLTPLTLTLPFSLATYLFVAHTLSAPHQALVSALVAAVTTGLVGVFCVGVVSDVGDGMWVAWCIERDANVGVEELRGTQGLVGVAGRRELVAQAFEYSLRARKAAKQAAAAAPTNSGPGGQGVQRQQPGQGPTRQARSSVTPQPEYASGRNGNSNPVQNANPIPPPPRTRYEEYPTHFSRLSDPSNSHLSHAVSHTGYDAYDSEHSSPESIDVVPLPPQTRQPPPRPPSLQSHTQQVDDIDPFTPEPVYSGDVLGLEDDIRTIHPAQAQEGSGSGAGRHSRVGSGSGEEGAASGEGSEFFPGSGIFG